MPVLKSVICAREAEPDLIPEPTFHIDLQM